MANRYTDAMRQRRMLHWLRLTLLLVLLAGIALLTLAHGLSPLVGVIWLWLLMLLCLWVVWTFLRRPQAVVERADAVAPPHPLEGSAEPAQIHEIMDVREVSEQGGVVVFRGPLRESAETAFEKLKQQFEPQVIPLLQQDAQYGSAVYLMPRPVEQAELEQPTRPWIHWLLFLLTIATTTWAGALQQGVNLLAEPRRFTVGLPYSLGLLAILGVHELGHFFAARRHRMNVTPPYFIPVPFALGTFGAFIKMRSPSENRRSLFDVAVAGPLAGLVIAIPVLLIGLRSSRVVSDGARHVAAEALAGSPMAPSILFGTLAKLSLGPNLAHGDVLRLSPLAFAGWLGLFITALNLLPIGQLDGGHTARAMFGSRVGTLISRVCLWALFLLALFKWPGLLMWAVIVYFLAGRASPPLNDLTPITPKRFLLGLFTFLILALILIPMPSSWW